MAMSAVQGAYCRSSIKEDGKLECTIPAYHDVLDTPTTPRQECVVGEALPGSPGIHHGETHETVKIHMYKSLQWVQKSDCNMAKAGRRG